MIRLLCCSLIFLCFACNADKANKENQSANVAEKKEANATVVSSGKSDFRRFIKNFKPIELPYFFRVTTKDTFDVDVTKLVKLNSNLADTVFIKSDYYDGVYCYGMLSDTSKFYSLLYFFTGDGYYPVLATYSEEGTLISQTRLIAIGCGSDCGLTYCSMTGAIRKDLSILNVDTVSYDFHCDENGELVNEGLLLINSQRGKVTEEGRIEMGEIKNFKKTFVPNKPFPKE